MALISPAGASYGRDGCLLFEPRQVCHMGPLTIFVKRKGFSDQHSRISESESLIPKCFHGQKCLSWTAEAEGEEG